jgi:hypothetical protein
VNQKEKSNRIRIQYNLLLINRDGSGREARFNNMRQMIKDNEGFYVVADSFNNLVRRVTPEGVATTIPIRPESSGS